MNKVVLYSIIYLVTTLSIAKKHILEFLQADFSAFPSACDAYSYDLTLGTTIYSASPIIIENQDICAPIKNLFNFIEMLNRHQKPHEALPVSDDARSIDISPTP